MKGMHWAITTIVLAIIFKTPGYNNTKSNAKAIVKDSNKAYESNAKTVGKQLNRGYKSNIKTIENAINTSIKFIRVFTVTVKVQEYCSKYKVIV